jgi:hypothetical protein
MITFIFINLALTVFVLITFVKFTKTNAYSMQRQLGVFEAAWAGFLSVFCLIHFFGIMEAMGEGQTLLEVAGKERLIQIFVLCGFGFIHLAIFSIIMVKSVNKRTA